MSCKSCAGLSFSDDKKSVCSTNQCNVSKDKFTYVSGDGLKGCFAKPSGTNPDNCCDLSKCPPPPASSSSGDGGSSDSFPWGWIIVLLVFVAIAAISIFSAYRGDKEYRHFMKHRRLSGY